MSNSQNRPIGIRIAAVLQIVAGSIGLLLSCGVILNVFTSVLHASDSSTKNLTAAGFGGLGEILPLLLLSMGQVVMGLGMLHLGRWSWLGSLILQIICLLDSLLPLVWGEIPTQSA